MFSSSMSVVRVLSYFLILSSLLWATPLTKQNDETNKAGGSVSIDSSQAHDFLSRPRRSAEVRWYQKDPDFQSYYTYYSSIGHVEGLYEIDKIRMLYQQMRHLEQAYGVGASNYQNVAAQQVSPTTKPPSPPIITRPSVPSLFESEILYLCNAKDPLCRPRIVYVPTGAVLVPCDPRYNPSCKLSPSTRSPPRAAEPRTTTTPPPVPMEYDCDPYWDPDCLIEKQKRPVSHPLASNIPNESLLINRAEKEDEEDLRASSSEDNAALDASYELFDYYGDLYDPYRYVNPE